MRVEQYNRPSATGTVTGTLAVVRRFGCEARALRCNGRGHGGRMLRVQAKTPLELAAWRGMESAKFGVAPCDSRRAAPYSRMDGE